MDGKRRRELKEQFKMMKPEMGIFIIRNSVNNSCYIESAQNLKAVINGTRAKLAGNMHPNLKFQKIWNDIGTENFSVEILENLEYDKDESKTDYSEELQLLEMIWEEKLIKQNLEILKKEK